MKRNNHGFTFIELMVVIAIMAIMAAFGIGNYLSSLARGRDAHRKADLAYMQRALESYYEDKHSYPTSLNFGSALCETNACANGEKVYMESLPNDPISANHYLYQSDGTFYRIYSCIESTNDIGQGVKVTNGQQDPNGYTPGCGVGPCANCKFGVASFDQSL